MRTIAAFDFDGTLTRRDTLYPFLRDFVGVPALAAAAVRDLPRLAAAALGRGDRDAAKARLFARVLGGRSAGDAWDHGRRHAERIVASGLRPEMIERLEGHRRDGHEVVIVSASIDAYLDVVGSVLGIDRVLCTRLEVRDGRLTGAMLGGNCRGAAKLARIRDAFGDPTTEPYELWAYGDSAGDDAMLGAADHAFRVRRDGSIVPTNPTAG